MFGFNKPVYYPPALNGTIKFVIDLEHDTIYPKSKIDCISLRSIGGKEKYSIEEQGFLTELVKLHGYNISVTPEGVKNGSSL